MRDAPVASSMMSATGITSTARSGIAARWLAIHDRNGVVGRSSRRDRVPMRISWFISHTSQQLVSVRTISAER